ncbi:MAG: hypothetical protein ACYC5O_11485 [Anaerolineae bacterium]
MTRDEETAVPGPRVIWKVRSLETGYEWQGAITAYWEVSRDPISDDYTPDAKIARDLFGLWANDVRDEYPNGLIPIYWFARCEEQAKFSAVPFQFEHFRGSMDPNWLTEFTWPINAVTGDKLNWFGLPVEDKLWNQRRADKGGFIQELTGWKPSILQPFVYLPALESVL